MSPIKVLVGIVLALSLVPLVQVFFVLGDDWQGLPPAFTDEGFYYAHIQTIAEGYYKDGNPYFFEHRFDAPLVLFAGAWINALPLLAGIPFTAAMFINFVLWGLAFAAVAYVLYREFLTPPWVSVAGVVLLYLESYAHIFRPVNLQPVYPFYFLFYLALARLMHNQSRTNILLLAAAVASTCYLFSYLWQVVAVTLGLLVLYAFARREWALCKAALLSSFLGGLLGLPAILYTLWLSHASPFFWESIARFGLVYTHIPVAEVLYSGGWIGVVLALLSLLYWCVPALRTSEFHRLCLFTTVSGLGLLITQGSNAFTGMLLETGEHVRLLILPWLLFITVILAAYLWRQRSVLALPTRTLAMLGVLVLALVSARYTYERFLPFAFISELQGDQWKQEQSYAKPLQWLQEHEQDPVVVWSEPHSSIATLLPIFTRHFTLFASPGAWHLVPEQELQERYLVSQYVNNPTKDDFKADIGTYLGRQDVHHIAKTRERKIKICRLFTMVFGDKDCGVPQTSVEILGETFFDQLEKKFRSEIRPNISVYLQKYHVSYILRDVARDPHWDLGALNTKRVYDDGSYELYHLLP